MTPDAGTARPQTQLTDLGSSIATTPANGRALIQAYQQLREEELSEAELAASEADDVLHLGTPGEPLPGETTADSETQVPSWLLAAVSLNSNRNPPPPGNDN